MIIPCSPATELTAGEWIALSRPPGIIVDSTVLTDYLDGTFVALKVFVFATRSGEK
jgi:hypothetical protein